MLRWQQPVCNRVVVTVRFAKLMAQRPMLAIRDSAQLHLWKINTAILPLEEVIDQIMVLIDDKIARTASIA